MLLITVLLAPLACLVLLAWVAVRSWPAFAWLTVLPNLVLLMMSALRLSMADRGMDGQGGATGSALPLALLYGLELMLAVLSMVAAVLGLGMRWLLRRMRADAAVIECPRRDAGADRGERGGF